MKVTAVSRSTIEKIAGTIDVPHAIISIGEPPLKDEFGGGEKANLTYDNPLLNGILWIQFYDLDISSFEMPAEALMMQEKYGHGLFTEKDAKDILDFLDVVKDKVDIIICNCKAGISRSSAVAAAILKILTGSDKEIFDNPRYVPNMFVYRTILNAWAKEK